MSGVFEIIIWIPNGWFTSLGAIALSIITLSLVILSLMRVSLVTQTSDNQYNAVQRSDAKCSDTQYNTIQISDT